MKSIKRFQIRGVSGFVERVLINGAIIDYWGPKEGAQHLLIAHDGNNVFDGHTSTHRNKTWEMAQSAIRVSEREGILPPVIIGVFHSETTKNPFGRGKDLTPEKAFRAGLQLSEEIKAPFSINELTGDAYLKNIVTKIAPAIAQNFQMELTPEKTAVIGSSMGALASLYALGQYPDFFHTALALSPHWPLAGNALVDALIDDLPSPGKHKVWMSHGTKGIDKNYEPFQKYANQKMIEKGYRLKHDFISKVYERSGHNEKAWARYLDQVLQFWLVD